MWDDTCVISTFRKDFTRVQGLKEQEYWLGSKMGWAVSGMSTWEGTPGQN